MPAPKDPEKRKLWQERLKSSLKGRKPWNAGKTLKDDPNRQAYITKLSKAQKGKRKGISPSPETRQKLSNALKGKSTGRPVSDETKAKLSKAFKGRSLTEETKRKLSEAHKGKNHTDETKKRMSEIRKGRPGTPHTEETKRKLSELAKQNAWMPVGGLQKGDTHSDAAKAKMSAARKGTPKSEEHKRKISDALKGRKHDWPHPGMTGKKHTYAHRKKLSLILKQAGPNAGTFKKGRVLSQEELDRLLVISKGYYLSGYHESPKAGSVHYRSSYELEVYKQLDECSDVYTYEVESLKLAYQLDGEHHWYVPDLVIHYKNGDYKVVEIKPDDHLNNQENQAKFLAAQAIYGDRFEVWSEELIFQQ